MQKVLTFFNISEPPTYIFFEKLHTHYPRIFNPCTSLIVAQIAAKSFSSFLNLQTTNNAWLLQQKLSSNKKEEKNSRMIFLTKCKTVLFCNCWPIHDLSVPHPKIYLFAFNLSQDFIDFFRLKKNNKMYTKPKKVHKVIPIEVN